MKRVVIAAEIGGTLAAPVLFSIATLCSDGTCTQDSIELHNQALTRHDIIRIMEPSFADCYWPRAMTGLLGAIASLEREAASADEIWFESPEVYRVLVNCGLRVRQERCFISNAIDTTPALLVRCENLSKLLRERYGDASEKE